MINMAAGGAAISVLSRQMGAQLWITDVGARHEVDAPIRQRCVRRGTDDISQGPAMSLDEAVEALEVGIETGVAAVEQGLTSLSPERWESLTPPRRRPSSASSPGCRPLR